MVQILGHTLKNWLLIMHGWPCLSNQAMYGALPMCCLGTPPRERFYMLTCN